MTATALPKPALAPATVYTAFDRFVCDAPSCAGSTALATGRTIDGGPVIRVTVREVLEWDAAGLGRLTCECGAWTATVEVTGGDRERGKVVAVRNAPKPADPDPSATVVHPAPSPTMLHRTGPYGGSYPRGAADLLPTPSPALVATVAALVAASDAAVALSPRAVRGVRGLVSETLNDWLRSQPGGNLTGAHTGEEAGALTIWLLTEDRDLAALVAWVNAERVAASS